MKRILFSLCTLTLLLTSVGCACKCDSCCASRGQNGGLGGGGLFGRSNYNNNAMCGCNPSGNGYGDGGNPYAGGYGYNYGQPPGLCNRAGNCLHGQPGPASAAVAYPYYTTRGPRDFLASNPPSPGP